jgi:hypothetical protein
MDQYRFLVYALDIYHGNYPGTEYRLSLTYTYFLYFMIVLSNGNIVIMRLIQAALCSFIPVLIFKLGMRLRLGYKSSQLSAFLYCFYGTALLTSLSFLRAVPLAFVFISYTYILLKAFMTKKTRYYCFASLIAGCAIWGRENFIPLMFAPVLLLIFSNIRKHVRIKNIAAYSLILLSLFLPIMIYNYFNHNSFSTIPGGFSNVMNVFYGTPNQQSGTSLDLITKVFFKLPHNIYAYLSNYEPPNSLSIYAHRDIIDFLQLYIVPFNLMFILACITLLFKLKNRGISLVSLLIASYLATLIPFSMLYRYRLPVVPLVCTLSGAGIFHIINHKRRSMKYTLIAIVLLLFFLTFQHPERMRAVKEKYAAVQALISNKLFFKAEDKLLNLAANGHFKAEYWYFLLNELKKEGLTTEYLYTQKLFYNLQKKEAAKKARLK